MKRLIVFYSLEGNTEYIADKIAEKLDADKLKLVPQKQYATKGFKKFFWGGRAAVMAEKPELEPYDVALSAYEEIIIGFPVWAGNITPPVRTFVSENLESLKNKDICTFACESGAGAEKAIGKLKDLLGIADFKATAIFIDPKAKPSEENKLKLDVFCEKL